MSRGMRAEGATMWRERRTAGGNANAVLGPVLAHTAAKTLLFRTLKTIA